MMQWFEYFKATYDVCMQGHVELKGALPSRHAYVHSAFNTLRPRQNGRHFPEDIFKPIFLNENVWISLKVSLKFVPKGPINNIPSLVQIMAWRRPGDKPLSEPMLVSLLTHKCVTRPQWVNPLYGNFYGKHKMYLQLISFLHTDMTQVVELFPHVIQELA